MARTSERREKILTFIRDFVEENEYPPTIREIMAGCDINSVNSVQHHLSMLEKEGHIHRDPDVSRAIQLTEQRRGSQDFVEVPLLGTIAAGVPIPVPGSDVWVMAPDEVFRIAPDLIRSGLPVYALRVKGTSMIDSLIDDGDLVIMESASTAQDGDTVAVWIKSQQEVTLKKIYHEKGRIRLQPANPLMEPIYVSPDDVIVQGRLKLVIRKIGR